VKFTFWENERANVSKATGKATQSIFSSANFKIKIVVASVLLWILASGTWNDSGVWDDASLWKDS
jgi:hypothetical protein